MARLVALIISITASVAFAANVHLKGGRTLKRAHPRATPPIWGDVANRPKRRSLCITRDRTGDCQLMEKNLSACGGWRSGARDALRQSVPADEARTGQADRAYMEHVSEA